MTELRRIKIGKENAMLYECIDRLTYYISDQDRTNKFRENADSKSYPYIPYNFNEFVKYLNFVRQRLTSSKPTFIDYGCGIGITIRCATYMGFEAEGVDYNKKFESHAIKFGDLTKYEFLEEYYDVVYFYSPFVVYESEISFEVNALESVKIGGYVICPCPGKAYEYMRSNTAYESQAFMEKRKEFMKLLKKFKIVNTKEHYPIIQRIK